MIKKMFKSVNITCLLQQGEDVSVNKCLNGLFSRNADGSFSFEEVLLKVRDLRNAKLFEGKFVSLVRRKDGKLQLHFKALGSVENPQQLAYEVYSEISTALTQVAGL